MPAVVPLVGEKILQMMLRILEVAKPGSQIMVMAFIVDHGLVARALIAAQDRGCAVKVLCDYKTM